MQTNAEKWHLEKDVHLPRQRPCGKCQLFQSPVARHFWTMISLKRRSTKKGEEEGRGGGEEARDEGGVGISKIKVTRQQSRALL